MQQANKTELKELTNQVKKEIEAYVNMSIDQCKATDTDIFGIGQEAYRFSHRDWSGDPEWNRVFPKLRTNVDVDVKLNFLQSYTYIGRG